jgi:thiol-disulfide isomerase/thioredoxin
MRVAIFTVFLSITGAALAVGAGDIAPAWSGIDETEQSVEFPAVIDGKPTVMVFWATWCPYCKAFMPFLAEIQKDYGEDKINVIMINSKERGAGDPVAYVQSLDFSVTAIMQGDQIGEAYAIDFIPGLLIVDKDGQVAWRRKSTDLPAGKTVGAFWDQQVREQLDLLL